MEKSQGHTIQSIRTVSVSELRGGYLALQVQRDSLREQRNALRAEVERLREALRRIAEMTAGGTHWRAEELARAALNGGAK